MTLYWLLLIVLYLNKNGGASFQDENVGMYRYQVALMNRWNRVECGGVIISNKWVMSLENHVSYTSMIMFGTNKSPNGTGAMYVNISNVFINGSLALFKIDNKLFEDYAKTSSSKLPEVEKPSNHQNGWLIGWHNFRNQIDRLSGYGVVMVHINVGKFFNKTGRLKQVDEATVMMVDNVVYELLLTGQNYINIFNHIGWIKEIIDQK